MIGKGTLFCASLSSMITAAAIAAAAISGAMPGTVCASGAANAFYAPFLRSVYIQRRSADYQNQNYRYNDRFHITYFLLKAY